MLLTNTLLMVIIGVVLILHIALGVYVYKDAPKYKMDRLLWVLIVVLVPNLMGLIIYLIVRSNKRTTKVCVGCGNNIDKDFKVCPYCSHDTTMHCKNCGKEINEDWVVCPYCKKALKDHDKEDK